MHKLSLVISLLSFAQLACAADDEQEFDEVSSNSNSYWTIRSWIKNGQCTDAIDFPANKTEVTDSGVIDRFYKLEDKISRKRNLTPQVMIDEIFQINGLTSFFAVFSSINTASGVSPARYIAAYSPQTRGLTLEKCPEVQNIFQQTQQEVCSGRLYHGVSSPNTRGGTTISYYCECSDGTMCDGPSFDSLVAPAGGTVACECPVEG